MAERARGMAPAADIDHLVLTAVSTDLRISEILALKWPTVDLDRGFIFVEERVYRGETDVPNSERSRRVPPLGQLDVLLRKALSS